MACNMDVIVVGDHYQTLEEDMVVALQAARKFWVAETGEDQLRPTREGKHRYIDFMIEHGNNYILPERYQINTNSDHLCIV